MEVCQKNEIETSFGYFYDANGNVTKDLHKNIGVYENIQYNYLNLPTKINGDNGSTSYVYDALGVKHQVYYQSSSYSVVPLMQTYCGNLIYKNGSLSKVLTEEGYLTMMDGEFISQDYYMKDHLGSIRNVVGESLNTINDGSNYYPFGMSFAEADIPWYSPSSNDQPYKFNGKELDKMHGLNLYDYGARMYDPAIGRFSTMDPLAEKYYSVSPYTYCANNPVNRIDPTGMDWYEAENGNAVWRRSQDKEYTDENGTVYKNIGTTYLYVNKEKATLFQQHTNDDGELYLRSSAYNLDNKQESGDLLSSMGTILSSSSMIAGSVGGVAEGSNASFRLTNSKGMLDFKFYGNGWSGNQWVNTSKIAKLGTGLSVIGRATGILGIGVSGYQFNQAATIEGKSEHGLDMFMGAMGLVPVVGTGVSLYWFLGGKQLHNMWVDKVLIPQIEMGINPGLPALQPFK